MKVLIIEDEIHGFRYLAGLLEQLEPGIEICGPVTDLSGVRKALDDMEEYDIIFSDIRLDDGLVFDAMMGYEIRVPVIFTTAYDEHAIRAFKYNGIDYLMKPIDSQELSRAISKSRMLRYERQEDDRLSATIRSLKGGNGIYRERFFDSVPGRLQDSEDRRCKPYQCRDAADAIVSYVGEQSDVIRKSGRNGAESESGTIFPGKSPDYHKYRSIDLSEQSFQWASEYHTTRQRGREDSNSAFADVAI